MVSSGKNSSPAQREGCAIAAFAPGAVRFRCGLSGDGLPRVAGEWVWRLASLGMSASGVVDNFVLFSTPILVSLC